MLLISAVNTCNAKMKTFLTEIGQSGQVLKGAALEREKIRFQVLTLTGQS